MDAVRGAALSMLVQDTKVKQGMVMHMLKQQQKQMQQVVDMVSTAANSGQPGRGDYVDMLV